MELRRNPLRSYGQFASAMNRYGFDVNSDFVRRSFGRYGYSVKQAQAKHIQKYTVQNIIKTAHYMTFIQGPIDWRRVKFVDEASFESKGATLTRS
jgi:hypothetical protein